MLLSAGRDMRSLPRSRYLSRHATLLPTELGGALRDETKNGCVGDYDMRSLSQK